MIGSRIDDRIQRRDGRFAAFQGKSFLPDVFGMEEFLKHYPLVELLQDTFLFIQGNGVQKFLLHFIGEPVNLLLIADIFEFNANMGSITVLQVLEYLPESGSAQPDEIAGKKVLIQVRFGESVKSQIEIGATILPGTDRIRPGQQMTLIT